ncbi:MAG: hypothetical protein N2169_08170, partial [bacterium]|nr:hypothetical protein [bacterium]
DKSGLAGIAFWINDYFKLPENEKVSKDNEGVKKIKEEIDKEYENGRIISISKEEMKEYTKKYLPEIYKKYCKE